MSEERSLNCDRIGHHCPGMGPQGRVIETAAVNRQLVCLPGSLLPLFKIQPPKRHPFQSERCVEILHPASRLPVGHVDLVASSLIGVTKKEYPMCDKWHDGPLPASVPHKRGPLLSLHPLPPIAISKHSQSDLLGANALQDPSDLSLGPLKIYHGTGWCSRAMVVVAHQDNLIQKRTDQLQIAEAGPFCRKTMRKEDCRGELPAVQIRVQFFQKASRLWDAFRRQVLKIQVKGPRRPCFAPAQRALSLLSSERSGMPRVSDLPCA